MAETTTPRLMAAAKEFNIGKDTLVDFLIGKGFSSDDLKPTSKLTEEMYRSLQQEFQSDKVAKLKSDQIDLPKGGTTDLKKKKDEEEIVFKKDKEEKKPAKKEEPKEEIPVVIEKPVEPDLIKIETPELEAPKVLKTIDLSTIDSSTRPKKETKTSRTESAKKTEEVKEITEAKEKIEKKPASKKKEKKEEIPVAIIPEIIKEKPKEEETPVIENIRAEKLEGPKILGKIELPVDNDTRPRHDEKRKRKRIPIEKKEIKREDAIKDKDKREGRFPRDNRPGTGPARGGVSTGGGAVRRVVVVQ